MSEHLFSMPVTPQAEMRCEGCEEKTCNETLDMLVCLQQVATIAQAKDPRSATAKQAVAEVGRVRRLFREGYPNEPGLNCSHSDVALDGMMAFSAGNPGNREHGNMVMGLEIRLPESDGDER